MEGMHTSTLQRMPCSTRPYDAIACCLNAGQLQQLVFCFAGSSGLCHSHCVNPPGIVLADVAVGPEGHEDCPVEQHQRGPLQLRR